MKLVRYGNPGKEKPGLIDTDGKLRDLSALLPDIGPAQLSQAALAKLAKLADLPGVHVFPSQANMLLLRLACPPGRASAVFEGLKARGVLVKNVSTMHSLLANCLRLTVGSPDQNAQLLAALRAALTQGNP